MFEDGIAYTFNSRGGTITVSFSESERTDTKEDYLAFGFITEQSDAVLIRVASGNSNDYLKMELVFTSFFISQRNANDAKKYNGID